MKLRDHCHHHPILAIPAGPDVGPALAGGLRVDGIGAVTHEHPVDLGQFGGRHFHSGPIGPDGRPLGYSTNELAELAPRQLRPSDRAGVRVWDPRLRH